MEFKIGKVDFSDEKTVIIAEAGVNHLGRMDYAEELIKTAKRAGADIIKFQTYKADKLVTKDAPRFWDWEGEKKKNGTQKDSYSFLDSFGRDEYCELIKLCNGYDIEFLSTPFDLESVDMLVELGMKGFKIASCDINNIPFLRYVAEKNLPVLLSTGASTIEDIKKAVNVIKSCGNENIGILQCTLCYPTAPEDANLKAILDIKDAFPDYLIGISDHTLGTIVPAASILYGTRVIEKHYTFDKTLPDSADHWLSLNEKELCQLVSDVRTLEKSLGSGVKEVLKCEDKTFKYARRSLVSSMNIKKGDYFTKDNLTTKRPGTGLAPEFYDHFIGKKASFDICDDTLLSLNHIMEED